MTYTRVGIDIGGTFTDFVSADKATGRIVTTKVPSDPMRVTESFQEALHRLGVRREEMDSLVHGTTVVTNLIIERSGARVGLITTLGFADVLEIGWSLRDAPYDLQWRKPNPLIPRPLRREVRERIGPRGDVRVPLDEDGVRSAVKALLEWDVEAILVAFLHGYANNSHEEVARAIIREIAPRMACVIASDVDPRVGEYERMSTGAVNAYSLPRIETYIDGIESWAGDDVRLYFMQSEGGVVPAEYAKLRPVSLAASGPSAGVLAASYVAQLAGHENVISFDVGGTSSDVCVILGGLPAARDMVEIEPGIPVRIDCVDVASIGAGGGSIATIDEGLALRVGPESAGADPGPACYGRGGEAPTVTDANVVLGIVDPVSLLGGRLSGDRAASFRALATLGSKLEISAEVAAEGVYRIANALMAQAIHTITVEKGIDPRQFALAAFGGAGGQHAVHVARELGIPFVLYPARASTLSAFGLLTVDLRISRTAPILSEVSAVQESTVKREMAVLRAEVLAAFATEGWLGSDQIAFEEFLDTRYVGQIHSVRISINGWNREEIVRSFEDRHEELFGTRLGDPVEVVNIGLAGNVPLPKPEVVHAVTDRPKSPEIRYRRVLLEQDAEIPVLSRTTIPKGWELPIPCLVEEEDSVLYLPTGTKAEADEYGNLLLRV